MSGSDFLWWLEDIWLDLTNLDTADLPSLFFRLLLLIVGGTLLMRITLAITRGVVVDFFAPAVKGIAWAFWRTVTAPVWIPYRIITRGIIKPMKIRRNVRRQRAWEREQKEAALREREAEQRRERERLAAIERIFKVD